MDMYRLWIIRHGQYQSWKCRSWIRTRGCCCIVWRKQGIPGQTGITLKMGSVKGLSFKPEKVKKIYHFLSILYNFDFLTVNLVTTCDSVAILQNTYFQFTYYLHKILTIKGQLNSNEFKRSSFLKMSTKNFPDFCPGSL